MKKISMKTVLALIGRQVRRQSKLSFSDFRRSCGQRTTSLRVARIAGKKLLDCRYGKETKSVLASALSQTAPKRCRKRRPKQRVLGLNGDRY